MSEPIYANIQKPKRRPLWHRWQFLVGLVALILGVSYLAYTGFAQSATYYLTVSELKASSSSLDGKSVRVSGNVLAGSIQWEPVSLSLKFDMTEGGQTLPVIYQGTLPNSFSDGVNVIARGQYQADGTLQAVEILTKCPSKYEARSES